MIRIVKASQNMMCDNCGLVTITKGAHYLLVDETDKVCPFCVRATNIEIQKRNNALDYLEKTDHRLAALRYYKLQLAEETVK